MKRSHKDRGEGDRNDCGAVELILAGRRVDADG